MKTSSRIPAESDKTAQGRRRRRGFFWSLLLLAVVILSPTVILIRTMWSTQVPPGEEYIVIRVGLLADMSERMKSIRQELQSGAELAVSDANSDANFKMVSGRAAKIQLAMMDSGGSGNLASGALDRLVDQQQVTAVVGSLWYRDFPADSKALASGRVIVVSPSLTTDARPYPNSIFRVSGNDQAEARAMLDLAYTLKKAAVVSEKFLTFHDRDSSHGLGIASVIEKKAMEFGLVGVGFQSYSPLLDEIPDALGRMAQDKKLSAANEKVVVFFAGEPSEIPVVFGHVQAMGLAEPKEYVWISSHTVTWVDSLAWSSGSRTALNGSFVPNPSPLGSGVDYSEFRSKLASRTGYHHPSHLGGFAYDSIRLIEEAAKDADAADSNALAQVIRNWTETLPYQGLTGPKYWNETGHLGLHSFEILRGSATGLCVVGGQWAGNMSSPPGTLRDFDASQLC